MQQFTVTPDLPGGLVLDAITGTITGTPTTIAQEATYTVVASNGAGFATAAVAITVNDAEPAALSYATNPATYLGGAAITPNAPTCGGGAVVSFSVSPGLPPGLSLDPATGVITGTPTALADGAWTVTATNSGGSTSAALTIHVVGPPPPVVTTQPAPAALYRG